MTVDVVYVLGSRSGWQDNELLYSLRSLQQYVSNIGQVFIVGEKPRWPIKDAILLPYPDKHICKERNIMEKLAYACGHADLSDNFLHCHDDHFMLSYQDAEEFPAWHGATLDMLAKTVAAGNHWRDAVQNTFLALSQMGLTVDNYDLHAPMLFNKHDYPEIMDQYDWAGTPRGFVVKSLYANTFGIADAVFSGDLKINVAYSEISDLVKKIIGRDFFSVGNAGLSNNFKKLMAELYPNPSTFEYI